MTSSRFPTLEFHVSRAARERYGVEEAWFSLTGDVLIADLTASRRLAHRMTIARDGVRRPERAVHAGQLHAMGMIDEILHFVVQLYRQQRRPAVMGGALEFLGQRLGTEALEALLVRFTDAFPPLAVHRGGTGAEAWLAGESGGMPHRWLAVEELLMLWLANANPAFGPYRELFDDALLEGAPYREAVVALGEFFATQPAFGPDDQSLVEMLRSPAIAAPLSLSGQLEYIRRRWGHLLGDLLKRLMLTLDVIREEERALFLRFAQWNPTARVPVATFRGMDQEVERFTPDRDWMPRVVMIAKSALVWLDQLSRRYGRPVAALDQVPDEELDQLARWGISALWLIGVWERSPSSQRIKQLCGNPDAGASAYSLLDYRIADALGGDSAYENLRERASRRGIRLASDMVPNHMGIDSRWVMEHPDWFLSLQHPPFPGYSFNGPDLSSNPSISLQIEDHYYDRTDAAVVFKRHDREHADTRYIYHGNDGTLMPWNDTAQLDYLNPAVREGLIQTILHVARHFPIIRFDAAMTLAKRHYQRLWFPEPGGGGAIPSRAEHGMTRDEFDRRMPIEFWREVVDRVAAEMPDTLLLAEAFWLMEGYFVRTLGMHRVYNSAFMNMLRDEENANYRSVIKNTLEFDPEILKRYVNFMSNPDERTAVDQFGKADKYFGVCILMATLPGLPMFGHGQIEGYTERYGMEFRRAGSDEPADRWLIERHEREIFPLLHRRHVFAGARDFLLYDFFTAEGHVNEDVFAYSNRSGDERALVLYNNRYAATAGWIRVSVSFAVKTGRGDEKTTRRLTLGEGLGVTADPRCFMVFREHLGGLEYLRSSTELTERGLYAQLDGFRCQVFLDFREVRSDDEHPWGQLAHELGGRGVPSADEALLEIQLRPIVTPFRELVNAELFRELIAVRVEARAGRETARQAASRTTSGDGHGEAAGRVEAAPPRAWARAAVEDAEHRFARLVEAAGRRAGGGGGVDPASIVRAVRAELVALLGAERSVPADDAVVDWGVLLGWVFLHALGRVTAGDASGRVREWVRAWRWDRALGDALRELGAEPWDAARATSMIEVLVTHGSAFRDAALAEGSVPRLLESWLADDAVQRVLRVHQHEGTWWFHQESWEALLAHLGAVAAIDGAGDPGLTVAARETRERALERFATRLRQAAEEAGYRLDRLVASVAS